MKRSVYVFSNGDVKRKDNTLYLETENGRKYVPVEAVSELLIFGEINLNKRLLEFLSRHSIIMHFFNHYGYYVGSFYPREHFNSGYMLLKQCEHYLDSEKRLILARKFVRGAVENIRKVLSYYANRGKEVDQNLEKIENLCISINQCRNVSELMAVEGNVRDLYYRAFDVILADDEFAFESRTRRPPQNRLNALISFANSLIYVFCLSEIYQTHLDPRIGFLHATNFRRFTLNLDVAEIFKPVIGDRTIFSVLNKGILKAKHFEKRLQGIILTDEGREIFVRHIDERMRTTFHHRKLGRHVSYRELIRLELYKIQKHLMGEQEYEPFVMSW
ncbi:type I-B CRISPR-associated endonuclease Cas1b [Thermodesulforhabdus norvegica]|uniref:CRISPR-associated endonuclease Cas1 n=1 Tax=Thermodesulforhabdus norvegica TaxID=39841 RepID=A0A1I4TMP4_9BACT|nr:type I-B CRISPR-associated endonuclease Cas1b [Thermodesulforhabdus norvegica]SFM78028.1 CRISP-associated protein Cas1 [Thermodesulforhabdus norvegica]